MQILKEKNLQKNTTLLLNKPTSIELIANEPSLVRINDEAFESVCLKCNNPRCIFFSIHEISCAQIESFPNNQDKRVCPLDAIELDENNTPNINRSKCIKCGLCASRCPIGAIYFEQGCFKINNIIPTSAKSRYKVESINNLVIQHQEEQITHLNHICKTGTLLEEHEEVINLIYSSLDKLNNLTSSLLIRNILIALGCNCACRRMGDVYTRMDLVYSFDNKFVGAIEVEFKDDTLSASRRILDDIAVLHSRYNIDKHKNIALVICKELPNNRQGYWQVIKDINNVEGIKINTITIGALLILLWNLKQLNLKEISYYFDYDNTKIRSTVDRHIGRVINIPDKYLGILEPIK